MQLNHRVKKLKDLTMLSDNELINHIHCGDEFALDYLIGKYKGFVHGRAHTYFLIGADKEDIIQEGMIGLYKAVRDFDEGKISSFKAFAELCITRQIITAIKAATRQKHTPLNAYVSLDKPIHDGESERTLFDVLKETEAVDPIDLLVHRESLKELGEKLSHVLSRLEGQVLSLYLEGRSYNEIAEVLKRGVKAIDNALQRIKIKLEELIRTEKVDGLYEGHKAFL